MIDYRKQYPEYYQGDRYIGPETDDNGRIMEPWLEQKISDYEAIHESDTELDRQGRASFEEALNEWKKKRPQMFLFGALFVLFPGILISVALVPVVNMLGLPVFYALVSGEILWWAIVFALGFRIVPSMEEKVVERLGNYYRVLHSGPRIILPFIDKIVNTVDMKKQEVQLYQDEGVDHAWDFTNASAGGTARAYYKVVDSVKFTYAFSDPVSRIEERFDSTIRPILQLMDIDSAQIHKTRISQWASHFLAESMQDNIGVQVERMLITDIDIPPEVQEARMKKLVGEKTAQETRARQTGYAQAINDLVRELKSGIPEGESITYETLRKEAIRIFAQQEGLDAIRKTGANVSLMGFDVNAIVKSLLGGKS